ncbi:MAG TPA: plasmid pRiA4b ORF-3 family protein [Candidatus Obscuribacter sp.]|nr:plasmid pRiA4b ORF-3 family protein [Candidatus Obscuribacter sp.]HNB17041.1 plasmid pRiA4b ORF-3 family protein [Candidatus Obscuribacter sp.]HND08628.1 plasmid pRiA4b ORF-3 family protein [Candidatus Obscuribacter sp.]HNG19138.1 plasmid pRiA4b ORF-3 family protein [Candidatus Obscuribacter sp.]HNH73888.1 plasmid pRiA4b ORF-3 family protein [Candidatus Obscuribacter sp.]
MCAATKAKSKAVKETKTKTVKATKKKPAFSYYQIKITLLDSPLPIWRRLVLRSDLPLSLVHEMLQIVMGWGNYHNHLFITPTAVFGIPLLVEEAETSPKVTKSKAKANPKSKTEPDIQDHHHVRLDEVLQAAGDSFIYAYDPNSDWQHELVLEDSMDGDSGSILARCMMGKRACPPEDVGGADGYRCFLDALEDPLHSQHQDNLDWVECDFDPNSFDARQVNIRLEQLEEQIKAD